MLEAVEFIQGLHSNNVFLLCSIDLFVQFAEGRVSEPIIPKLKTPICDNLKENFNNKIMENGIIINKC